MMGEDVMATNRDPLQNIADAAACAHRSGYQVAVLAVKRDSVGSQYSFNFKGVCGKPRKLLQQLFKELVSGFGDMHFRTYKHWSDGDGYNETGDEMGSDMEDYDTGICSDKAILEDKLQLLLDIAGLIEITKAKKPPAPRNRRKQTPKRIENCSKTSQPTNQSIRSSSLADQLFERSERLWADRHKDRQPQTYGNGLAIGGCDTDLISYDDHIAELPTHQFDESDVVGPPLPQPALEECADEKPPPPPLSYQGRAVNNDQLDGSQDMNSLPTQSSEGTFVQESSGLRMTDVVKSEPVFPIVDHEPYYAMGVSTAGLSNNKADETEYYEPISTASHSNGYSHNHHLPSQFPWSNQAPSTSTADARLPVRHDNIDGGSDNKKFDCTLCDYKTSWKGDLKRHMRRHTKEKPYKCDLCSYASTQTANLKIHILKKHPGQNPRGARRRYRSSQTSLPNDNHTPPSHDDQMLHPVESQPMPSMSVQPPRPKLMSRPKLGEGIDTEPIKIVSTPEDGSKSGSPVYQCTICDYKSVWKGDVKRHMRRHTKERPYKCPMPNCSYASSQSTNVKTHIASKHVNLRPYKCTQCAYAANRAENLRSHVMSKHGMSGYMPSSGQYECFQCPFVTTDAELLQSHVFNLHGMSPNSPPSLNLHETSPKSPPLNLHGNSPSSPPPPPPTN